jgi:hypothetical protein
MIHSVLWLGGLVLCVYALLVALVPVQDQPAACDFICYDGGRCHGYCEVPEIMVQCDQCVYQITETGASFDCAQCDTGTY